MKKIMFNDRYGLTKAVLEGRKTMTRRIITVQPANDDMMAHIRYNEDKYIGWQFITAPPIGKVAKSEIFKPHYKVGEIVAVAQSYEQIYHKQGLETMDMLISPLKHSKGWDNKMFIRSGMMPHYIRITSVRAERLQDISDEECLREGIWKAENICIDGITYWYPNLTNSTFRTPREAFASLIDKVSGRGTWNSNPYVWVYEFELLN